MAVADGLVGVMGEPVSVHVGSSVFPLSAVFRQPYVGYTVAGVPIERPDPSALFTETDWATTGAKSGDSVTIRGTPYTIVSTQARGGSVEVVLR